MQPADDSPWRVPFSGARGFGSRRVHPNPPTQTSSARHEIDSTRLEGLNSGTEFSKKDSDLPDHT